MMLLKKESLELYQILEKKKLILSTVESCTGGIIAASLTSIPGISSVFLEGLVTYSNESKIKRVGVKKESLDKFGAVSKEVVAEMLLGLETDCGIAVSGIAGPSGGTLDKPVGTVFIGVKYLDLIEIQKFIFKGSRNEIQFKAAKKALEMMTEIVS